MALCNSLLKQDRLAALFLLIYSESIRPTKFLYVYKFIGLDEIYKMVSSVFQYIS